MLQKSSTLKIAQVFFDEPTKQHYLMEISRKANLAHTATKNILKQLEKDSIITKISEKKGKRTFPLYEANKLNNTYKFYKKIANKIALENSKLISFLHDKCMPNAIILFGSYARGEDTEESDIDLFIESEKVEISLEKFEKKLKRTIQLHYKRKFKDMLKELKNNIMNGIVLDGYVVGFE